MGLNGIVIAGGASIDVVNSDGFTLLHNAILDGDNDGAIFLLNNGADIDLRRVFLRKSCLHTLNLQQFATVFRYLPPST